MTTEQQTEEQTFDAAFAEFAGAADAAANQGQSQEVQQPAEGDKPKAQGDQQPVEREAKADAGVEQTPAEQLAELRDKLAQAEHRERSSAQRISTFHKKFNDAQAQVDALTKRLQEAAPPRAAADKMPPAKQDDPDLSALLSEMPELGPVVDRLVASRVRESVGAIEQQVQQVQRGVEPLHAKAEKDAVAAELAVVEKEFPQWREIVFSEPFKQWIDAKPASIRDAYDRASTAADGLEFLRMYDREQAKPAASQAPAPAPAAPSATAKQDRLAMAVGIPSRPAVKPAGGMPAADDFEGSFHYFAARQA